jgi:hypothetical protein
MTDQDLLDLLEIVEELAEALWVETPPNNPQPRTVLIKIMTFREAVSVRLTKEPLP